MILKTCTKCGQDKSTDDFHHRTASTDGLSPICKTCRAPYRKAQYAANREKAIKQITEWKHANPDKARQNNKNWIVTHPDEAREIQRAGSKKWKQKNPEAVLAMNHTRRARLRNVPGTFSAADIAAMQQSQGGLCYYCAEPLSRYEVDHKIPISRPELSPTNSPENLCLACPTCNSQKRNKTEAEFFAYRQAKATPPHSP